MVIKCAKRYKNCSRIVNSARSTCHLGISWSAYQTFTSHWRQKEFALWQELLIITYIALFVLLDYQWWFVISALYRSSHLFTDWLILIFRLRANCARYNAVHCNVMFSGILICKLKDLRECLHEIPWCPMDDSWGVKRGVQHSSEKRAIK